MTLNSSHPETLYGKWCNQSLTVEDILVKVIQYARERSIPLSTPEATSIARQLHRAYRAYYDPKEYPGEFIVEFASDSFRRIIDKADTTNRKALFVYHLYFYNCAPGDWREKLK